MVDVPPSPSGLAQLLKSKAVATNKVDSEVILLIEFIGDGNVKRPAAQKSYTFPIVFNVIAKIAHLHAIIVVSLALTHS